MAGGIGSRFWPESRNDYPKQFLDILGTIVLGVGTIGGLEGL